MFSSKILKSISLLWQRVVGFTKNKKAHGSADLDKELVLKIKQPHKLPSLKQLFYLPRITKKWEHWILIAASLIFLGSVIILIGNFLNSRKVLTPKQGGEYVEAVLGGPKFINPLWAGANDVDRDLVRLIYTGLFTYNNNLEIVPDLANNYETSEDGKTYTVRLKQNLKWQDGEPLTSSDVVFTITSIQNPLLKSPMGSALRGVSVSAPDAETVVFTLLNTSESFLHQLTLGILPEHLWSDVPPETAPLAELNIKPIGAGPYRFKSLRKTKQGSLVSYSLEANPFYHAEKPFITNLTFKFFQDYESALDAVSRGNADGIGFVPYNLRERITKKGINTYDLMIPQITALFFNQKRNLILAEKPTRDSLARAINKKEILSEAFHDNGTIINGPILQGFPGYTEDTMKYDFDGNQAAALLDTDGWKLEEENPVRIFKGRNKNDRRFSPNTKLHISLAAVNVPEYVRVAEIIRDKWTSIGVEVELIISEPSKIERDIINSRAYDVLLYGEIIGADPDPFPFWHSSQIAAPGVNLAGYANRRIDALIEEARATVNTEERARRYDEFQKIIASELPAIFLINPTYTYAIRDRVHGVEIGRMANPADRFTNIAKWFVKTRSEYRIF